MNLIKLTLLFTCCYYQIVVLEGFGPNDPDMGKNVSQLITSRGYPVEEHTVITEDGYILGIQRIPAGRREAKSACRGGKKVVMLSHGLFESSADFVWNFPHQSLGFILADRGYDVWLTNVRGNAYGERHVSLSEDSDAFWAFSIDEMALIDMRDILNYVVRHTGQRRVRCVGFSLGVNQILALLSEHPEYQEKVHSVVALAPAVYFQRMTAQLKSVLQLLTRTVALLNIQDTFGMFTQRWQTGILKGFLCGHPAIRIICQEITEMLTGTLDLQQLNLTRLPLYLSHFPSGVSFRVLKQEAYQSTANDFSKHSYGPEENRRRYGQDTPPVYPLEKIRTPVAIIWGPNDQMVPPPDAARLRKDLKNVFGFYRVPNDQWSHLDFIWGMEAYKYVYKKVLEYLKL